MVVGLGDRQIGLELVKEVPGSMFRVLDSYSVSSIVVLLLGDLCDLGERFFSLGGRSSRFGVPSLDSCPAVLVFTLFA